MTPLIGTPSRVFHSVFLTLALLSAAGCQWKQPAPVQEPSYDPLKSESLNVPPKRLIEVVRNVMASPPMSVAIASDKDGVLLTDWKEYQGEIHIVRRWQERTRFKVTILPDFSDPLGKSHVQVLDETEQKPSEQQPWYPAPELRRPDRSAEVLRLIEQAANATAPRTTNQS